MERWIRSCPVCVVALVVASPSAAWDGGAVATNDGGVPAPSSVEDGSGVSGPVAPGAPLLGSWSSETEVPGGSYGEVYADTAVTFRGQVYLFGVGVADHRIYVNRGDPTTNQWSYWFAILAGRQTYTSVAAAVYAGRLYVIWADYASHYIYCAYSDDGTNWTVGNNGWMVSTYQTDKTMAATVWYGRLYLFFKRQETYPHHYYTSFNGSTWAPTAEVGPGGAWTWYPDSVAVYNNKIWLFGIGTDQTHWSNIFDGYAWTGWTQIPGGGTTAVATYPVTYNNRLHLFAIGIANHQHYVNVWDGSITSGWYQIPGLVSSTVSDTATVFKDKLWLFSVSQAPEGRHWFTGCTSTVGCGGGTDNGDAILYQGSCGSANHVHVTAESAKSRTLYPTAFSWPDGHSLDQEPGTCVWLRSGYRFTYGSLSRLGGTQNTLATSGTFALGAARSFLLSRNPPSFGPASWVGAADCGAVAWANEVTGVTHSESAWYTGYNTGVRMYPAAASNLCGLDYGGAAVQDFGSSGAWHTGALDFYDGHVYLPISYHNPDRSYIFAFDRQLEWEQQYDPVGDASWVAINPVDGFIYGSSFYGPPPYLCPPMIRVAEMLFVPGVDHPISFEPMPYDACPSYPGVYPGSIDLTRHFTPPHPDALRQTQAAVFSRSGYLYLFDQGGGKRVFVFKIDGADAYPISWWDVDQPDEAEGIFLWDFNVRTDLPRFVSGGGQLHLVIRDNLGELPDHGDLKSYSVPHWAF